jgi:uncharacterized protein YdaU (DUF1376 family)
MRPPAFQLYADDFISGTSDMTDAEVGLYMRLLCAQWSRGGLPNDIEELLRFSRGSTTLQAERVKRKFVVGDDGQLRNARLEAEREKQAVWREKSRLGGKKSGVVRNSKKGGSTTVQPPYEPTPQPKGNSPLSTLQVISPTPLSEPKAPSADRFQIPSEEELRLHASKIGLPIPEMLKFQAFYESKGWMVGKRQMKSWHGAMAGWKIRWEESRGIKPSQNSTPKAFIPDPSRGILTPADEEMLRAAL